MKRLIVTFGIAGLLLMSAVIAQAQAQSATEQATKQNSLLRPQVAAGNNQTAVACSLCFTCGGDWPVFAGSTTRGSVTERGGSCSGVLHSATDNPFLCCR